MKLTKVIKAKSIETCLVCPYITSTITDDGKKTFRYYCNGYDFLGRRWINKRNLNRLFPYIPEWCDLEETI